MVQEIQHISSDSAAKKTAESLPLPNEPEAAANFEQEQPPWESFDDHIDDEGKRKPPTAEQVVAMDKSLAELGAAFAGSNLNWHLDGGLNISLHKGEYIGNHKDVDVSVEQNELAQVEAQLEKSGYGLFLSRTADATKNKVLRRVSFKDFNQSASEHMLIAAIDDRGKVRRDKALNFVDVHIIQRNERGEALGEAGVVIPEKWNEPQTIEYKGQQINLSHPAKVLYYKLHQSRNYDRTDAQRLVETGKITPDDMDDIERTFEDEFAANRERGKKIFVEVAKQCTPEMTAEEMLPLFLANETVKERGPEIAKMFEVLVQKLAESPDRSAERMFSIALDLFGIVERDNKKRAEIAAVRQQVIDVQRIKQLQSEIKA